VHFVSCLWLWPSYEFETLRKGTPTPKPRKPSVSIAMTSERFHVNNLGHKDMCMAGLLVPGSVHKRGNNSNTLVETWLIMVPKLMLIKCMHTFLSPFTSIVPPFDKVDALAERTSHYTRYITFRCNLMFGSLSMRTVMTIVAGLGDTQVYLE
jgi:hypothetical protein